MKLATHFWKISKDKHRINIVTNIIVILISRRNKCSLYSPKQVSSNSFKLYPAHLFVYRQPSPTHGLRLSYSSFCPCPVIYAPGCQER